MELLLASLDAAFSTDTLREWLQHWGYGVIFAAMLLENAGLLRQSPEQMDRLRDSFLRHAGKSVRLGRFVAVLRVIAGPMAGAVGMPYRRFLLCNAVGAVLWAATKVRLAWLGGRWIPFERMVRGVVEFGVGAPLQLTVNLLIPKLVERWQEWRLGEERPRP